ncbi:ATP-binding protein [Stappia sp.]|jgi:signal transduction histidine kinase|uniref:ATP-binding protein n=1 Tax=Stappia sp. TaxID=1870903 RepID=UPI003A9A54E0
MSARARFRLWPRSLAGQLIALLLIAVVGAQLITLWLFTDERRVALVDLARNVILSRTGSLVRWIDASPPDMHDDILGAVSSPFLRFWVASDPALARSGDRQTDTRLAEMLSEEIGDGREVRIDVVRRPPMPPKGMYRIGESDDDDVDRDAPKKSGKRHHRWKDAPTLLTLSVSLSDGRWLNGVSRFRVPRNTLTPLLVTAGLMAAAIVLVIAFTVRRLTRPLRDLSAAAERLGRGEDVDPLVERGPSEVRGTIHAFNVMQDRLTRFVRDRTRMLGAISHDLRTPITSLRIRAEFIDDDENREKMIETLDEMQRMVEATLALARDEASREDVARIDLGEFLEAIVEDYRDIGQTVSFEKPGRRIVSSFRPLSLKRALRNLVENALRYGKGTEIKLEATADTLAITVLDNGPGIPEDRLQDVFEPFVRLEESRSEETGGIGLGLSITRSIVHAHGGTLVLSNRPEGGLSARIVLPMGRTA